jgi:hypothetical protein
VPDEHLRLLLAGTLAALAALADYLHPIDQPDPPGGTAMIKKLVLIIVFAFLVLVSCLAVVSAPDRTADPPVTVTTPASPSTDHAAPAAGIGTEVRDGEFAFVVTEVRTGVATVGSNEYLSADAQGAFTIVTVQVRNVGDQAQTFSGSSQKLFDAAGREYSADSGAAIYLGADTFLNEINPGNQVTGQVVFDLPADVTATAIELHDSPFSDGVLVALG